MGEQVTIETAFCMHKGNHPTSNYEEEDWVGAGSMEPTTQQVASAQHDTALTTCENALAPQNCLSFSI